MTYAQAKTLDQNIIPVIDISPLRDGTNPKAVARELHAASQGLGFIYIKGHGIPEAVIKSARANALEFFALPEATKRRVSRMTGELREASLELRAPPSEDPDGTFNPAVAAAARKHPVSQAPPCMASCRIVSNPFRICSAPRSPRAQPSHA